MLLYIGTYTEPLPHVAGRGEGIYTYHIDLENDGFTPVGLTTVVSNPTYLALNSARTRLYAVQEADGDGAAVFALAADQSGKLTLLNSQPVMGGAPAHLILDRDERHVIVANYGGGNVSVHPLLADGRLGGMSHGVQHEGYSVNAARQEAPHAHGVALDRSGDYLFVADLGIDKVMVYRLEAGELLPHDPPFAQVHAGAGPRHLAVHPNNRFVYVVNELDSTVVVFTHHEGVLQWRQTLSALPEDWAGESWCAAIRIAPSGRYLYASNRGHDSIAIFACDEESGELTALGHEPTQGAAPRDFALTPDGDYLLAANQDTDTVIFFGVDAENGQLQPTGMIIDAPNPVSLVMTYAG